MLSITGDNVVIDTVKKAEDDNALIVRLYESHGCRGRRTLTIGLPVAKVIETDLMEREERELPLRKGRKVALTFTPFQIRTLGVLAFRREFDIRTRPDFRLKAETPNGRSSGARHCGAGSAPTARRGGAWS